MPLIHIDEQRKKIQPCICGKRLRETLYRAPELSPDKVDIGLGTAIILVVELVLPILFWIYGAAILIPFVVLPLPLLILTLAVYRYAHGHKLDCAFRWSYLTLAGAGRFLSF